LTEPRPTEIKLRSRSRVLDVAFDDGTRFEAPIPEFVLSMPRTLH
jgi:uncharacterized protein affecting Mg2+/Co2+ transport